MYLGAIKSADQQPSRLPLGDSRVLVSVLFVAVASLPWSGPSPASWPCSVFSVQSSVQLHACNKCCLHGAHIRRASARHSTTGSGSWFRAPTQNLSCRVRGIRRVVRQSASRSPNSPRPVLVEFALVSIVWSTGRAQRLTRESRAPCRLRPRPVGVAPYPDSRGTRRARVRQARHARQVPLS
jgi:hypothetical protein